MKYPMQMVAIDPSNYGGKNRGRRYVIVHGNAASAQSTIHWLKNPKANVSYHYMVKKDGTVLHFVDEDERAWHSGRSHWGHDSNLNDLSVGIAFESREDAENDITKDQYEAMLELIRDISKRHDIAYANVLGHKEVSPGRKTDPKHVNMDKLRKDLERNPAPQSVLVDKIVLHGPFVIETNANGEMELHVKLT